MVKFDYSESTITKSEVDAIRSQVLEAKRLVENGGGAGDDFLGWVKLPENYDKEEFVRIKEAAKNIQGNSDVLVVIGIGGSYLGARAAIEMINSSFFNALPKEKRGCPSVVFAGNNISANYMNELLEYLSDKDFSVNVISKSGTTTEPAIAFRLLSALLEKKYGTCDGRVFITTDKSRGAMKKYADEKGFPTFVVPDDIGGRYSVLTAVGLLPIAVAGIDIDAMMKGACDAMKEYSSDENACIEYAAVRNILYRKGKTVEILANYEPRLHYIGEWWKQLYGESEGKNGMGIFPAAVDFSTDLHSLGQYIQQGRRVMFETVLTVKEPDKDVTIINSEENTDGLNFLSGKTMNYVNSRAFLGTLLAHTDGQVPNLVLEIEKMDAYNFGFLAYFFEKACGISGYTLGVNPFDQPGVEAYKKNMFALLNKPGYEEAGAALYARLKNNLK
ncbi:MAG: glucose-6-phosphate isomerase [Bacillota bacterium]|nr:glucose-6-phosphate isomerase [Bacillota bacterium]